MKILISVTKLSLTSWNPRCSLATPLLEPTDFTTYLFLEDLFSMGFLSSEWSTSSVCFLLSHLSGEFWTPLHALLFSITVLLIFQDSFYKTFLFHCKMISSNFLLCSAMAEVCQKFFCRIRMLFYLACWLNGVSDLAEKLKDTCAT